MKTELEVCVVDSAGVIAAIENGADCLELCSALEVGGLTPTPGFVAHAQLAIPTRVLIRPRGGHFVYSSAEIDVMLHDIAHLSATGVEGFVIGALTSSGELDTAVLRTLLDACEGLEITLHRAFDHVANQELALEQAIELGFHRILTSGGCSSVLEGLQQLKRIQQKAGEQIRIVPGGGITTANIETILSTLQPSEVHASCRRSSRATADRNVKLGSTDNGVDSTTDPEIVGRLASVIHSQS